MAKSFTLSDIEMARIRIALREVIKGDDNHRFVPLLDKMRGIDEAVMVVTKRF